MGSVSLAGQVTWERLASTVIGGSFGSIAITLSAAMAGFAGGAMLAGASFRQCSPRKLLFWGVVVCSVTLAVIPQLVLEIGRAERWPLLRIALTALLLGLGHLPFGAVLPFLITYRQIPSDRLGSAGGELYALSALGAFAGSIAAGAGLATFLGFDQVGILLGGTTLLTALIVLLPAPEGDKLPPEPRARPEGVPGSALAVAFSLGALALVAESLWLRVLGFYWEASTLTFSLGTASTVGGLSLGSFVASQIARRFRPDQRAVGVGIGVSGVGLFLSALTAPLAVHASSLGERASLAIALLGLPSFLFGATFILLMETQKGGGISGRAVGLLTGTNAAGAAAGPLLLWATAPLVAWPAQALFFVAGAYAALAGAVLGPHGRARATALLLAGGLGLYGWVLAPACPTASDFRPFIDALPPSEFDSTVFPFVSCDLDSTVTLSRETRTGVEILWLDRCCQGDTSALGRRIPRVLGRFPATLLGRPARRAMVIGLGTGMTLSGLVDDGVHEVHVSELSRGVIDACRTVLAEANGHVLERGEVRVHQGDGRTALTDAPAPFDLILTDMTFPTAVGAGNLYTREFYRLARRRLTEDGLFVHWIPCSQLSPEDLSSVIAAFLDAFPEGSAWIGSMMPRRLILGLVGGRMPLCRREGAEPRFAMSASGLRKMARGAAAMRDAEPSLEYRSRPRADSSYGIDNLRRVVQAMEGRPAWRDFAEAGLVELRADAEPPGMARDRRSRARVLYQRAAQDGLEDAAFLLKGLEYARDLEDAQAASEQGDEQPFLADLERAASCPLHGMGHVYLAEALAARGRYPEALSEFEKAVVKSPRSADAHLRMAMLACALGDVGRARKAFQAAVSLRPDRPWGYQEMARRIRLEDR